MDKKRPGFESASEIGHQGERVLKGVTVRTPEYAQSSVKNSDLLSTVCRKRKSKQEET